MSWSNCWTYVKHTNHCYVGTDRYNWYNYTKEYSMAGIHFVVISL